ncbi:TetR family transcriptional regulator [Demetria terragena]|uniref:TetR family transcriptional regulator n=1 Tax=Demetria terragena TaxID=63959 RepID=UPI001FDF56DF|nr:TetR family transcriptional regulator [Demetria terragena]
MMPAALVRERSGACVRTARLRHGLTVRQLATMVHVSPATITAIEHGRTSITLERLTALASALETPATDLLGIQQASGSVPVQHWRDFAPLDLDPALSGAARAFVSTGYHGATMRSIALTAGVSPAGIYHHYASKHDLLRELMIRGVTDLLWRVESAFDEGAGEARRLEAVVESLALWHARRGDIAVIGASEMRSLDAIAHREVVLVRRRVQHLLDEATLQAAPTLDRREALDTARAIATMCTSIPRWFKPEGDMSPEDVARQHARFALRLAGHHLESPS